MCHHSGALPQPFTQHQRVCTQIIYNPPLTGLCGHRTTLNFCAVCVFAGVNVFYFYFVLCSLSTHSAKNTNTKYFLGTKQIY